LAIGLETAKNVGATATIKSAPSAGTVAGLSLPRTTAEVTQATPTIFPFMPETGRLKIFARR
jgi:hypothetical protein